MAHEGSYLFETRLIHKMGIPLIRVSLGDVPIYDHKAEYAMSDRMLVERAHDDAIRAVGKRLAWLLRAD